MQPSAGSVTPVAVQGGASKASRFTLGAFHFAGWMLFPLVAVAALVSYGVTRRRSNPGVGNETK